MIGIGGEPGLQLGGSLVVRGASGSSVGLAHSELLSALLGIALPLGRECLVAAVDPNLPPDRAGLVGFLGSHR